jgi:hypothetical protein
MDMNYITSVDADDAAESLTTLYALLLSAANSDGSHD